LTVYVPGAGESRKTIEVGPGTADTKGRISVDVRLDFNLSEDQEHLVSTAHLSIPAEAKRLYLKAESQLERMEVEGATASLQKAVEIAPRFMEAWNHLGTIAYLTRKYEEAEKYFRKALEQEPEAFAPLVNLGGTLLSLQRIEEALDVNQHAVRLKPDEPLAQSQLGMSYYYLGRYDQAEASLKQAKSLDPGHFTMPQLFLAEIYERTKNVPAAIRELESFLKLHPDSPRAPSIRGKLEALRKSQADHRPPPPDQSK
jgi:tetratricopeptide (TPR) repeat protein